MNPLLLLVTKDAGHGGGKTTAKVIEGIANDISFLIRSGICEFHAVNKEK